MSLPRRPLPVLAPLAIPSLLLLAGLLLTVAPLELEARVVGSLLLTIALPGWLLVQALAPAEPALRGWVRPLVALAAGYALAELLGLATHLLIRQPGPGHLIAAAALVNLLLMAVVGARGRIAPTSGVLTDNQSVAISPAWQPALVLALAALPRLFGLDWSEFQGDEARILLRAMAALQGLPDALAAHRKVPGEIMLVYLFYGQLGAMTELAARLPFALAGTAAVLAFWELARRLFGARVALLSALLLAVNGYAVAFGRILQYDSLALLLGTVGLLCSHWYGRAGRPRSPTAALAALCLGGGLMLALGAIFFVPPALILAWPTLRRHLLDWRMLLLWGWPLVPLLVASAYVILTAPGQTGGGPSGVWSYLGPRLGGDRPYFNGEALLRSANHYLSTPYLALVGLAAGGAFLLALHRALTIRWLALGATAVAIAAAALALLGLPRHGGLLAAAGLPLLLILGASRSSGWRMALAWAAGPLLVHLFLVRFAGTHFREAFPGLVLLAAVALVGLAEYSSRWLARPLRRPLAGLALALAIGGTLHYDWVTLIQRWPEYQLTYPRDRHPLDWSDATGRGIGGVFGVSHRHGWKALALADQDGRFPGGYGTNESPAISAWYLRRPMGCPDPPEWVFRVTRAPQDRFLTPPVQLSANYPTVGAVNVEGHETLLVQARPGTARIDALVLGATASQRFDRELSSPWRPVGQLYQPDLGTAAARAACGQPGG